MKKLILILIVIFLLTAVYFMFIKNSNNSSNQPSSANIEVNTEKEDAEIIDINNIPQPPELPE
ncbi:MAG: hypothetical protein WCT50_02980 [Patescibacteria group bacterium]